MCANCNCNFKLGFHYVSCLERTCALWADEAAGPGGGRLGSAAGLDPPRTLGALRPGGAVCLAAPALLLGRLPPRLPDAAIRGECASFGALLDVVRPDAPAHDEEAFVVFSDIRCGVPS